MFLKTKDHMGKDIALNIDNIICAQPGYQKGLTKLIMSGNLAIDIAMEFEEFINPAKPVVANEPQ